MKDMKKVQTICDLQSYNNCKICVERECISKGFLPPYGDVVLELKQGEEPKITHPEEVRIIAANS